MPKEEDLRDLARLIDLQNLDDEALVDLDLALFQTADPMTQLGRLVEDRPEGLDDA